MAKGESIGVRNPYSTRPYQHVLEPLAAYLLIAQRQYEDNRYAGYYNVGPDDCDCVTTGTLVDLFCQAWGDGAAWENRAGIWRNVCKRPLRSARYGFPAGISRRRWTKRSRNF